MKLKVDVTEEDIGTRETPVEWLPRECMVAKALTNAGLKDVECSIRFFNHTAGMWFWKKRKTEPMPSELWPALRQFDDWRNGLAPRPTPFSFEIEV